MNKKYTVEELNQCSKETLIALFLSMQAQMERLNQNIEHLVEQVALSNQKRFGRSSEKMEIKGQLSLQECFQVILSILLYTFITSRNLQP